MHSDESAQTTTIRQNKVFDDLCLICCSRNCANNAASVVSGSSNSSASATTSLISKQLNVIFILRNLLEIPSFQLVENLKVCGGPENWIYVCEECAQLTVQARELHYKIVEISKQLKSVQKQILEKIKGSGSSSQSFNVNPSDLQQQARKRGRPTKKSNRKVIWHQIRTFVKQYDYVDLKNPFCEGDILAQSKSHLENNAVKFDPDPVALEDASLVVKEEPKTNFTSSSPRANNYLDDDPEWFNPETLGPEIDFNPQDALLGADKQRSVKKKRRKTHRHPTIRYRCTVPNCPERFYFASRLFKHLCSAHAITEVPCVAGCENRTFRNVTEFLRHRIDHKKGLNLKCTECDKEFMGKRSLDAHIKNKHFPSGQGPFICELCGNELSSPGGLHKHKRYIHGVGKDGSTPVISSEGRKRHLCDLCGASLKSLDCLSHHKQFFHEKRFLHSCHLCGLKVMTPSSLKLHLLRTHKEDATEYLQAEGIRLHHCPVVGCRRVFLKKQTFERHTKRIHGGGGCEDGGKFRFSCSFCGKGFFYKQKLKRHEEIHSNEGITSQKCPVCSKVFNRPQYLQNHLRNVHKIAKKYNNIDSISAEAAVSSS